MNKEIRRSNLSESEIILAGETIELNSIKNISEKFRKNLPPDGKIYYQEITKDCYALISSVEVFIANRVIGIGLGNKATDSTLKEIRNFYISNNRQKFYMQVSPVENNKDITGLLLNNGGELLSHWAKLYKIPDAVKPVLNEIEIREIYENEHDHVASLLLKSFSFPEELKPFVKYALGVSDWISYVAILDGKIAGTGSLYIKDDIAEIGIAATAEEYRGIGVQTALIKFRENIAFEKGCSYLFVETAEPTSVNPAQSYKNMIRLGFTELYRRPNYMFKI
ncbi:MAG TPA: GNAT family N-acetyltransferase [Ignavibacteria bacterium]|nr:GNAT family N-acetyltransferase [Ignavibacteria bacterium]